MPRVSNDDWMQMRQRKERAQIAEMAGIVDDAMAGPPLIYIQIWPERTRCIVWMQYNELLLAIMRQIPSRRWHRPERCWTVPTAMANELENRLKDAGAHVSVELMEFSA